MQSMILTTAVILFPLWGALWEKGPLTTEQLEQKPVYSVNEAIYPYLKQQLSSEEVTMRRRIYSALAAAPVPANQDFLLNHCLKAEKNSEMRASILRFMHRMEPEKVPPQLLEALMKDEAPSVALEAMRLYCLKPEAKASSLMQFLGTPETRYADSLLERTAWKAFADNDALADALGKRVFEFMKSQSPEVRRYAFSAALAQSRRDAQLSKFMEEALDGPDEMRLALAQDRHPTSSKIPMKLVKDRKVAVRQALCECEGSIRFPSVLVMALKDNVASVRIAALKSLAKLDEVPGDVAAKVFPLLNDSSFIVRTQAEETFAALARKCDANVLLEEGLSSSAEKMTRYHSLHVVRRIGAKSFAKQIAAELSLEDSPEIAAASLDALASLAGKGEYASRIIPFAKSESQLVRQMAARAMGRLQLPGSENALIGLTAKGNAPDVCAEAYEAMGHFPQPIFIPVLIACLRNVKGTSYMDRGCAAWALGRIKGGTIRQQIEAAKRLQVQCTKAVIPDVEPMFDDTSVIANAFWTLAEMSRRTGNPEIRKCYDEVVKVYNVPLDKLNKFTGKDAAVPRSEMTCCMIMQVRQYHDGKEQTTMPVPVQELSFPIMPLSK